MFQIGDKVKLVGCPFDEQIAEEAMMYAFLKTQVMTVTKVGVPGDLHAPWVEDGESFPGQHWIITDMIPDFTAAAWFEKVD